MATKTGNLDDFNFYLKLSKPLVLNLPNAKDRAMAALWLKKLGELNSSQSPDSTVDNIYVECLKLLLLAMQTDRLTGIFEKPPPSGDLSDVIPSRQKAQDMVSLIKTRNSSQRGDEITYDHPRVVTSIGGDLCEYVAIQEIPNFGIHGYYALSSEPLSTWTNPRSDGPVETEVSDCFKRASEKAEQRKGMSEKVIVEEQNETAAATFGSDTTGVEQLSRRKHERTKHSEKSLQKIFQAQRSEIAGVETRPCWGRLRYIDRLIDESPHLVADLELSEADAMLHLYRDTKFRKTKQASKAAKASATCAISSRRRNVEKRLDLPPCAVIGDEDDYERFAVAEETAGSRTCLPKNLDLDDCRNIGEDDILEYDGAPYDCPDDEYESELLERTEYDTWPGYAYEYDEYPDQFSGGLKESYSNISQRSMESMDPEIIRDAKRLIADPTRREPPSSGKVKVPRRRHSAVEETWNPPGHSTSLQNR